MASNQYPSLAQSGSNVHVLNVAFHTTAAAEDKNVHIMHVTQDILVLFAKVVFETIDTFASGVDIDLESDNGTTELVLATYDTAGGTAVDTVYAMTPAASMQVAGGYRLQLHIDDDEDTACIGHVELQYITV